MNLIDGCDISRRNTRISAIAKADDNIDFVTLLIAKDRKMIMDGSIKYRFYWHAVFQKGKKKGEE